jgi:hypothetical protein
MGEHYYLKDGSPFYEVPTKTGGLRSVHIGDVRKALAVPSVTTVLNVIAKPALTEWMVNQGILAALTLPRIDGEAEAEWLKRVKLDGKQQAKDAADEGTRIHDALEASFKGGSFLTKYNPHVDAVRARLIELYPGVNDWVAEAYIPTHGGYGGKCDLHSPSTGITVDYKGKDGDFSDRKKLAYDQHWQLGPYQGALPIPKSEGVNIFVSRTHPGKVAHHIWTPDEMEAGRRVFSAAHSLWIAMKGYNPLEAP